MKNKKTKSNNNKNENTPNRKNGNIYYLIFILITILVAMFVIIYPSSSNNRTKQEKQKEPSNRREHSKSKFKDIESETVEMESNFPTGTNWKIMDIQKDQYGKVIALEDNEKVEFFFFFFFFLNFFFFFFEFFFSIQEWKLMIQGKSVIGGEWKVDGSPVFAYLRVLQSVYFIRKTDPYRVLIL